MPTVEISGDASLNLTTALLIYESGHDRYSDRKPEVDVTQHAVTGGMIQPGAPLDLAAFRKLLDRGGESATATRQSDYAWQFPRLLAESKERIVWWSPAGFRSVFVGLESNKKLKPRACWFPSLIWCAHRARPHCYLWAYGGEDAPAASTTVYGLNAGGMSNIHHDNSICLGSTLLASFTPAAWEAGFWSSRFTSLTPALKRNQPYACKQIFKALGSLSSVLPRSGAAD